jgi:hypothetical protein
MPGKKAAKPLADFGPIQVLERTDLTEWQWQAGTKAGLIPAADRGGRWSAALVDEIAARRDEIVAAVGTEAPIGSRRAAERLAARTGLDVEGWDVEALAEADALTPAGWYKKWVLWDCRALDGVDIDQLAAIVAERQAWLVASVSKWDAPALLGWRRDEFERVTRDRGVRAGRFDRYAREDLDALAADEELTEQVRADRLLMSHQAAEHLEIRPTDFRHLVGGGLIAPYTYTTVEISRHKEVSVPLYRTGDLDGLRERPDIDWEAVWSVRKGEPSPLRHLARRRA